MLLFDEIENGDKKIFDLSIMRKAGFGCKKFRQKSAEHGKRNEKVGN